jgi:DNA repair protein RecN (Recombination protein N)
VHVDDQTQSSVRAVDGAQRIEELAEMIGGQRITDTTRAQARELLESAKSGNDTTPMGQTTKKHSAKKSKVP